MIMNMETITAMDRIRRAATDALAMAGQAVSHLRELEYDAGSITNPELVSGTIRSNYGNALAALADAHQQLGRASWAVGLLEDSAPVSWNGRTFGQLTPDEKRAAARAAGRQLSAELAANAGAISAVLGQPLPGEE